MNVPHLKNRPIVSVELDHTQSEALKQFEVEMNQAIINYMNRELDYMVIKEQSVVKTKLAFRKLKEALSIVFYNYGITLYTHEELNRD